MGHWYLQTAARKVRQGGVIAYPTEAVWGVGCDPWNARAVQRLFELKQRPQDKGVILIAARIEQLDFLLADLPAEWRRQLAASWPGHCTWLVPHRGRVPEWIRGRHASVAVRVSAHPGVQALCALTGPLVSTSANPAGAPPARSRLRLRQYFGDQLDAIVPGPLGGQERPSRICDLQTGRVIRP